MSTTSQGNIGRRKDLFRPSVDEVDEALLIWMENIFLAEKLELDGLSADDLLKTSFWEEILSRVENAFFQGIHQTVSERRVFTVLHEIAHDDWVAWIIGVKENGKREGGKGV